ncbi:hypothetical protein [Kitasatospora cinereorecta]|uniref:Protein kilB n=1 Tax=Kitasatospora cinereorecta TaxID=285560 RepID=A0ABW0V9I2_9ACTN
MDTSTWVPIGTSVVAVVGTLAGTLLAGLIHSRTSRTSQAAAEAESRRSEILSTVTALVAALDDHRRAQMVRTRGRVRSTTPAGNGATPEESYTQAVHQTRSAVTGPSVTLRIICPELAEAAERAVAATFTIRDAESLADAEELRLRSKLACDALVTEAGRFLAHAI